VGSGNWKKKNGNKWVGLSAGTEQAVGTRGEITELEKTRGWEQTVGTEGGNKRWEQRVGRKDNAGTAGGNRGHRLELGGVPAFLSQRAGIEESGQVGNNMACKMAVQENNINLLQSTTTFISLAGICS
jgi:hypothetical protein